MDDTDFLAQVAGNIAKRPRSEVEEAAGQARVLVVFPEGRAHAVAASREDPWLWEVVRALVELLRQRDPEALKESPLFDWIVDVAVGMEKPRRPGPGEWKTYSRDGQIGLAVYYLRLGGHTVESAFDTVGLRLKLEPDNVHRIWYSERNADLRERLRKFLGSNTG